MALAGIVDVTHASTVGNVTSPCTKLDVHCSKQHVRTGHGPPRAVGPHAHEYRGSRTRTPTAWGCYGPRLHSNIIFRTRRKRIVMELVMEQKTKRAPFQKEFESFSVSSGLITRWYQEKVPKCVSRRRGPTMDAAFLALF